jgi:hypothetical protein
VSADVLELAHCEAKRMALCKREGLWYIGGWRGEGFAFD